MAADRALGCELPVEVLDAVDLQMCRAKVRLMNEEEKRVTFTLHMQLCTNYLLGSPRPL